MRTNNVVLSSGKFPRLTATDIYGRTSSSSFVPSGKGTARLEIGHLPDEIEDLRRWFAGYYRRSVQMKGKKDRDARGGIKTGDDGEVEVRQKKGSSTKTEGQRSKKEGRKRENRIALVYRSRSL